MIQRNNESQRASNKVKPTQSLVSLVKRNMMVQQNNKSERDSNKVNIHTNPSVTSKT